MIITCPRCAARYVVEPNRFGLRSRRARCSNCDHVWIAEADRSIDPALPPPEAVPPRAQSDDVNAFDEAPEGGEAQEARAPWPDDDDFAAIPPPAVAPSEPPAPGVPDAEEKLPRPFDDDADLDIALGGDEDLAGAEPAPETEVVAPVMPSVREAAIAAAVAKRQRERRRALIITGAAGAALLLCIILLIGLRAPLTRAIPGMAALYHLVGLAPAPPGANLDIGQVSSSREWADGEDVLIVTGTVTNTADEPREVPPLRVTLFDAADREVQEAIVEPEKSILAPRENVHFNARIAAPAATARRMVVSFDITAADEP